MTPERDIQALLLCFRLQDSRIAVVSSTAAATLRQLVMFVVDKMVEEDKHDSVDPRLLEDVTLPDGTAASLGPFARDAYAVFEDLCLLANSESPHFLNLEYLHKTFALELIESVLTNYHELFRKVCISLLYTMFIIDHTPARTTFDAPQTPPLPDVAQVVVRQGRVPADAPMYPRRVLAFETILIRIEDRSRSVPHVTDQNDIRRYGLDFGGSFWLSPCLDPGARHGNHARVCLFKS